MLFLLVNLSDTINQTLKTHIHAIYLGNTSTMFRTYKIFFYLLFFQEKRKTYFFVQQLFILSRTNLTPQILHNQLVKLFLSKISVTYSKAKNLKLVVRLLFGFLFVYWSPSFFNVAKFYEFLSWFVRLDL